MKKTILGTVCLLALTGALAYADDDFGSDFGSFGDSDFGSDSFGGGDSFDSDPALLWSGEAGVKSRTWFNTNESNWFKDFDDLRTEPNAYLKLDLDYSGTKSDVNVKLKVDTATIKDNPEDVLEEATIRGYFDNWTIEAGKMKNVWGKGDKIHVLDNFNANDYTDFIFPDYIDRRIAEPMVKASYAVPNDANIKIEGVFTPTMTADRFAKEGSVLYPAKQAKVTSLVKGIVASEALSSLLLGKPENALNSLTFDANTLYPDTKAFKYCQAGLRATGTVAGFDWGVSYYYGHSKQPSADLENYARYVFHGKVKEGLPLAAAQLVAKATESGDAEEIKKANAAAAGMIADAGSINTSGYYKYPEICYDMVQTFGLEAAAVLWKFNTRWEFAYNLTKDFAGDNPWVKNNWISWVAGFDIDIPLHNLNLNVQETGSVVLNSDKIGDEKLTLFADKPWRQVYSLKTEDVDYNTDDKYHTNKLIVLLKDTFLNEKLSVELQGIWGIENEEFVITPKVEYNVIDGLTFNAQFAVIYSDNENGEFYQFTASNPDHHTKAFVQLGAKYRF